MQSAGCGKRLHRSSGQVSGDPEPQHWPWRFSCPQRHVPSHHLHKQSLQELTHSLHLEGEVLRGFNCLKFHIQNLASGPSFRKTSNSVAGDRVPSSLGDLVVLKHTLLKY